jgi:hypothetical protein
VFDDVSRGCGHNWGTVRAQRRGVPKDGETAEGQPLGWHSLRRKFASELKATPLRDLAHLSGWKGAQTILTCYIAPDEATQRAALEQRKSRHARGLSYAQKQPVRSSTPNSTPSALGS